jgi:hypothetical protein
MLLLDWLEVGITIQKNMGRGAISGSVSQDEAMAATR